MKLKHSRLLIVLGCSVSAFAQTPSRFVPPQIIEPNACSIILMPDIQSYSKFGRNHGITELMTAWIADNLQALNVIAVMQNGDLVEQNGIDKPDGVNGDQTGAQQWRSVSRAFERLDGNIPYILATGNHDYGITNAENRNTQLPNYFPIDRNSAWQGVLVECCRNRIGKKTLENAAYEFKFPQGDKLLIVSLEFAPSNPVLAWAKTLISSDAYKDCSVILMTHSFIKSIASGNARVVKENYKVKDVNYGQAIWDKLVFPSDNIRLVICGHIAGVNDPKENIGFRVDKNYLGKPVSQMLFNAQTDGGGWYGNGGDGWLRILEFSGDGKRVSVRTFSPLFAISPSTRHLAWRTESYNQFVFQFCE